MPENNAIDYRHLSTGLRIPSVEGGYVDQPYVVINADGSWTCTLTTGSGHEGDTGQHIAATRSEDQGRSWAPLVPIEPPDGPEASWAQPLLVPETGRIYVFYTFNRDNLREVKTVDGGLIKRVDSLGVYAYRYSDDQGRSWSDQRYEIPARPFACDRRNAYGGEVLFFWGVGKPFIHQGEVFIPYSKVGGFGRGFFDSNEGAIHCSPNLLTQHDPAKHEWLTLPEGDRGLRTPPDGGPIAGEPYIMPMNDGSLYGTYRTIDGYACHAYSRDRGRSWDIDWMRYTPGGRRVKNPRSANFVWRCANGKYVYWYNNHGGEPLARHTRERPELGYAHRNPTFLCGGVERDGYIHWSQPEIVLYDDHIGDRWSYPDFIEQDGRYFLTETQKTIARVHAVDPALLEGMWRQGEERAVVRDGLRVEHVGRGEIAMPALPPLHDRGGGRLDPDTGATLPGEAEAVIARGGFTLEFRLRLDDLAPWQMILDSRDDEGRGMTVMITDRRTLKLSITGRAFARPGGTWAAGMCDSAWDCEPGLLEAGKRHHVVFIVDGGPKLVTVLVDGVLCDGGPHRQYGWGRFHPHLKDANGADHARVGPDLHGEVERLRIYDRCLRTSEAVANYHAAPDAR